MTYAFLQHITIPLSMLLSQSPTFIVSTPHSHVHLTPNLRYLFQVNPNLPRHSRYSSLFTSPIWTLHQRRPGCVLPVIIHDLLTILCSHFSPPHRTSPFTFAMLHDHLTPVCTAPHACLAIPSQLLWPSSHLCPHTDTPHQHWTSPSLCYKHPALIMMSSSALSPF